MNSYKNFFSAIAAFEKRQAEQKQRGLNDYNILTSVLKASDEVRLHSGMIYSLLDSNGAHYQGSLFLEIFIEVLNRKGFSINAKNCNVYKEYNNIDLYITDGHKHIIIENKVHAADQKGQIKRYISLIEKEGDVSDHDDILLIYLSIDQRDPSNYSLSDLEISDGYIQKDNKKIALYKAISYKKEIMNWLNKCQYEVQNITNLNEAIRQYKDVVKMINNAYRAKTMTLSDYIKKDKLTYQMALDVQKAIPLARQEIVESFFTEIINLLKIRLGNEWIIFADDGYSKRWGSPFKAYKSSWAENSLIFVFEFDQSNYQYGYFGVARRNELINIESDICIEFEENLKSLNYKLDTEEWWLHWEFVPNANNTYDFSEYVMFEEDSKEKFIDFILKIIGIFEMNSGLLTRINNYLSAKAGN
ncbi:MAG: PD-(D/E)XK nuclease family protein [Thiolinea sp.]